MKIFYISHAKMPSRFASSIHQMKMCQAFANNQNDVTLVIPLTRHNFKLNKKDLYNFYGVEDNFSIQRIPMFGSTVGYYLFAIITTIYCVFRNPDICYGRSILPLYFTASINLNTIYETHSPKKTDKKFGSIFRKMLSHPRVKRIVLISDALKRIFDNDYGSNEKFYVAHDGADINNAEPKKIMKDNKHHIGYVGHLYKGRGIELIVELAKQCDWAIFHVIGGNDEDISYWSTKTQHIENLILHGFKTPKEIPGLLKGFNILLAPYQKKVTILNKGDTSSWMSPLKVFEYMSSKKPIVCSDIPVLREVLKDKTNSLLCDPEDANQWITALKNLRDDENLGKNISENAFQDIVNKYSWKQRAINIVNNSKVKK